jgi:hypothetical protein
MLTRLILVVLGMLTASQCSLHAEGLKWDSAGMRGAFSGSSFDDPFHQVELYANMALPWRAESKSGCYVQTRLDLAAGWLHGRGEDGFVGSAGPGFSFGKKGFPIIFDLGTAPTVLSRDRFDTTDFGVPIQFTTHAGFLFEIGARAVIGYRFQHMSNAHIDDHNPGLDLHSIGLGYRF